MAFDNEERAIPEEASAYRWPELFGQLVLDFTKVLEAQARVMRASIGPALTSVLDRWLWHLVIASVALAGCSLLIGAAILVLHMWVAWWLAFLITGAMTIVVALCGLLIV